MGVRRQAEALLARAGRAAGLTACAQGLLPGLRKVAHATLLWQTGLAGPLPGPRAPTGSSSQARSPLTDEAQDLCPHPQEELQRFGNATGRYAKCLSLIQI